MLWCRRAALDESHVNAAHAVEKHARRALRQTLMKAASEHSSERGCHPHTDAVLLPHPADVLCVPYVPVSAFLHQNSREPNLGLFGPKGLRRHCSSIGDGQRAQLSLSATL